MSKRIFPPTSIFTIAVLFCSALGWLIEVHETICLLAIDSIDTEILEDLKLMVGHFPEYNNSQKICGLASLSDVARDSGWDLLKATHYGNIFSPDQPVNKDNLLVGTLMNLEKYLTKNKKRSIFFDTLSLSHAIHLLGELFQPFHTFQVSGYETDPPGTVQIHEFWGSLCGKANIASPATLAEMIKESMKSKKIKGENSSDIRLNFEDGFKDLYRVDNIIEALDRFYKQNSYFFGDKTTNLYNDIADQTLISSRRDDYNRFCLTVAVPLVVYSAEVTRNFIEKVYENFGDIKSIRSGLTNRNYERVSRAIKYITWLTVASIIVIFGFLFWFCVDVYMKKRNVGNFEKQLEIEEIDN